MRKIKFIRDFAFTIMVLLGVFEVFSGGYATNYVKGIIGYVIIAFVVLYIIAEGLIKITKKHDNENI